MKVLNQLRANLVPILLVLCFIEALYCGAGLLLMGAFAVGVAYGFAFAADPKLFILLLVAGSFVGNEGRKAHGGGAPIPVTPDWLDICAAVVIFITTLTAIVTCFVFGIAVGFTLGDSMHRTSQQ
jgi:hypothetical protein